MLGCETVPKMDWDAFHGAHFRPHLVAVHLADIDPKSGASVLDRWLAGSSGNYAIQEKRKAILVAFEVDNEAAQLSRVLKAVPGRRDDQWASKTQGRLDCAARIRIARASPGSGKAGRDRNPRSKPGPR
jgi:hypothetical protein